MLKILLTSLISQFFLKKNKKKEKKENHFCARFVNLQRLSFCKSPVLLSCHCLQKMLLK